MVALAMTLPLARRSPIHVPRRDIVIGASDDLNLNLTLVASDTPSAAPLDLVGLGTQVRMVVWCVRGGWDYGPPYPTTRAILWSAYATVSVDTPSIAAIAFPRGTASADNRWQQRLAYTVQLDYGGDLSSIAWGALQILPVTDLLATDSDLLDDNDVPITDDADEDIEV